MGSISSYPARPGDLPDAGTVRVSSPSSRPGVGILIEDATHRGLVESASAHLELTPVLLTPKNLDLSALASLELIVADGSTAQEIRNLLATREETREGINPAVIAAIPMRTEVRDWVADGDSILDGVLPLPQAPAPLAVQLSLILYAHRGFAKRYRSAMEELRLNRSIFRSVTSGICVVDATLPDSPVSYVNPAFESMTGYTFEEVRGRNCRFLQGDERDQPGLAVIREALRDQREAVAILKNFKKDGTPFWNELSLSPVRNRDGVLTHVVGIQMDITERVEFETALRDSEKLAAVGRLASTIAHEINNPLESVMNLVYIAQRTESQAETRSFLAMADTELQRVKLITSKSLRFYKQSTRPQGVGCSELLDSLLTMHQSRIQNSAVLIDRRDRLTRPIVCMESEIRQVLNNLVGNAIDAMHGRGGRLVIRSREATDWRSGDQGIVITVADTGTGIDDETLQHMFQAFYTTKGIGGTGLGLWISSEIVERHRGRLLVRSRLAEPGSGTVFTLFLPFQSETS